MEDPYELALAMLVLALAAMMLVAAANGGNEMRQVVAAIGGLVIALLLVFNGLWSNNRTKVTGPTSTIWKSGEMKSPGGFTETGERRI